MQNKNQTLREKSNAVWQSLPFLPRALRLVWQAAWGWMLVWLALLFLQGVLPALSIWLTRALVDQLSGLLGIAAQAGFRLDWIAPTVLLALGIAGVMLYSQLNQNLISYVFTGISERVSLLMNNLVQAKAVELDYAFYDLSENYDRLHRAQYEARYRPVSLMSNLGQVIQSSITLFSIAGLLLPYGVLLSLALIVASAPALGLVVLYQRLQEEWQRKITASVRRSLYYEDLLMSREGAAEVRLFNLGDHFRRQIYSARQQVMKERLQLQRKQFLGQTLVNVFGMLIVGACLLWMAWRALQGQATLGDLTLFYQAFNQGRSVVSGFVSNLGEIYGSLIFLRNMFEFLDLESKVHDPAQPQPVPDGDGTATLQFHGVKFSYPGMPHAVLEDFNMVLPGGKTIAIVGDNGTGKSTLVKLMCRLYDPQAGQITWNGVDLKDLPQAELHQRITVLFQDPVHYFDNAHDNVAYSRWNQAAEAEIYGAAELAGIDTYIRQLPQGYQTMLGRMFDDGIDPSLGQWQRIALARAFLRRAPLILLDEPTSAMDAWAEADWLDRLRQVSAGRTTVVITHRLTTARHADLIYVMWGGKVVETGTHAQLLASNGRYAAAWKSQMNQDESVSD